ncbi:MAG: hypothetical protein JNN00_16475 [Chitinophagaceae bacterium]|nr:hypothetical protein [Chitinophagaceae bacterium]
MKPLFLFLLFCGFFGWSHQEKLDAKPDSTATADDTNPYLLIREGQKLLRDGDLVVRLNKDPLSQFIKNFNRQDKKYSHAGITFIENGQPYIYHMITGRENPGGRLKKDKLSSFAHPKKNAAYAIFRYSISSEEKRKVKELIHSWYDKEIAFDSLFDLRTNDKMYCAEMISKAFAKSTGKRIVFGTTMFNKTEAQLFAAHTHLPLAFVEKLKIVSIDNLYCHPLCKPVQAYDFKKRQSSIQGLPESPQKEYGAYTEKRYE